MKHDDYDVSGSNIRNRNGWIYLAAGIAFMLFVIGMYYLMDGIAWKTQ